MIHVMTAMQREYDGPCQDEGMKLTYDQSVDAASLDLRAIEPGGSAGQRQS